jgi:hypothetical protein
MTGRGEKLLITFDWLCPKSSPCRDLKSSLRPLRISVISALNNYRDYSYAGITEIRRDR